MGSLCSAAHKTKPDANETQLSKRLSPERKTTAALKEDLRNYFADPQRANVVVVANSARFGPKPPSARWVTEAASSPAKEKTNVAIST